MSSILAAGILLLSLTQQSVDLSGKAEGAAVRSRELPASLSTFIDDPTGEQEKAQPPGPDSLVQSLAKKITLGGQIRVRGEYRDPTSYANAAAAVRSDELFLTRIRLNIKFSLTDDIDVFIQPQDERQWGQEVSVLSDERNLDLHQGFVEVRNIFGEPLSIKAGRMELSYGDQRLVSPLDWSNIGRTWDGAKIRYAPKDWWVEGFWTVIKDPLPTAPAPLVGPAANVGGAHDQEFLGAYFSYIGIEAHEFDVYCFLREFRDGSVTSELGPTGNLIDRTAGARIKGADLGFDYTLEGMSQTGHWATDQIYAYAYAGTLGYTFDMAWTPRIGVEYDFASGDRNPNNGKRNTFDPLFPFGHYYQGFADTFAFKNGKDAVANLKVTPMETLVVEIDYHTFWLSTDKDAWYNAAGTVIRRDLTGLSTNRVGEETDLHARLAVGKYVKFWAGWSHVFAGPYVRQTDTTGTSRDMNWLWIQMTVDF